MKCGRLGFQKLCDRIAENNEEKKKRRKVCFICVGREECVKKERLKKRFGCEVFSYREGGVYGNTLWFCYVGVLVVTCECYGEFIFNAKKMCCITLGKGF
jgi:hypothetical protein